MHKTLKISFKFKININLVQIHGLFLNGVKLILALKITFLKFCLGRLVIVYFFVSVYFNFMDVDF